MHNWTTNPSLRSIGKSHTGPNETMRRVCDRGPEEMKVWLAVLSLATVARAAFSWDAVDSLESLTTSISGITENIDLSIEERRALLATVLFPKTKEQGALLSRYVASRDFFGIIRTFGFVPPPTDFGEYAEDAVSLPEVVKYLPRNMWTPKLFHFLFTRGRLTPEWVCQKDHTLT